MEWHLPRGWGDRWEVLIDTAAPGVQDPVRVVEASDQLHVTARSLLVLRRV